VNSHTVADPVILLFTDPVNSTALWQCAGDEQAQRIFQAHHKLLKLGRKMQRVFPRHQ
jgi:hypothetical protein